MSSKEAVACAKQVSSMLEDTQSGKLAKVDTSTHWPKLEFTAPAFVGRGPVPRRPDVVGRGPVPRRLASCSEHPGGPQVAALQDPPIQSLADAVAAVCQYDEETAILEPWAQLLARMNKLTQRVASDIEAWKASCEKQSPNGVGRADQPGSFPADVDECSTQVRRGTADAVPVQQQQPVQPLNRQDETSSCGPSSPSPTETPPNRGRNPASPAVGGGAGKPRATDSAASNQPSASSKTREPGSSARRTRSSSLSGSGKLEAGSGYG